MTKEERRKARIERQRKSDERVYGKNSMLGEVASDRRGRMYDVDTTRVRQDYNKEDTDERIQNDGIDRIVGPDTEEESDLDFNGTVILCINGNPYYINIAYDADKGPYSITGNDPDFPILEP